MAYAAHMRLRTLVAALAVATAAPLLGVSLAALPTTAAQATCYTYYHSTGTDGNDYVTRADNFGGGNVCFSQQTTEPFTVASQSTPATGKVLAYPDNELGCQWGASLDCTTGFQANQEVEICQITGTTCGTQRLCSLKWTSSLAGGVTGTQTDDGFDIWSGTGTTPSWANVKTEIFVRVDQEGLPTGYTTWPTVQIVSGTNTWTYYYQESAATGNGGAWKFVQLIRKTFQDSYTDFQQQNLLSWVVSKGWMTGTDRLWAIRAGYEIYQNGAGLAGGPLLTRRTTDC